MPKTKKKFDKTKLSHSTEVDAHREKLKKKAADKESKERKAAVKRRDKGWRKKGRVSSDTYILSKSREKEHEYKDFSMKRAVRGVEESANTRSKRARESKLEKHGPLGGSKSKADKDAGL